MPRTFEIEMHGLVPRSSVLTKEDVLEAIYLGPARFYRIIDVAVCQVGKDFCTVFLTVSGHEPGTFSQTWNQPPGSGPFKQVLSDEIKVL